MRKIKNTIHLINAFLACLRYQFPARSLYVIGVTGTDGKTSTAHMIYEILKNNGKKVSIISTVYAHIGGVVYDTGFHVTTPNPWKLQKLIKKAVLKKDTYLVLEVTSHGLDQNRVWGINYHYGILTNISHEHIDYHKTYESYRKAKFKLLKNSKTIIVNRDDQSYAYILKDPMLSKKKMISYGLSNGDVNNKSEQLSLLIPGKYNISNALAALATTSDLHIAKSQIKQVLSSFKGVYGRMDEIKSNMPFRIIVDFAHTPNALKQLLSTLRPLVKGNIIHVFGCAGKRDVKKRSMMGEVSARYSDKIILTEEDYRTEQIFQINAAIKQGINMLSTRLKRVQTVYEISNRQNAINHAIIIAQRNDLVLVTGKGHEQSLCRGTKEFPWSDHKAIEKAVQRRSSKDTLKKQ